MLSKLIFISLVFSLLFYGCTKTAGVKPPQPLPQEQTQTTQEEKPLSPEEQKNKEAQKEFYAGLMAINHGKLDSAANHLKAALEIEPESLNARLYLAGVYEKMNKNMLALGEYQKAKDVNPKDPRPYNGIIGAYINMGLVKEAIKLNDEVEKNGLMPEYVAGSLGWAYYLVGDFGNARKNFELLKDKTPDTTVINNLGLVSFSEGKYAEALEYFRDVEKKNPKSILAPYFIALTEMKLGHEDEALEALKEGLKKDPQLEDKAVNYKIQYFPRVDAGDLSPLFAKIEAEKEKEMPAEGEPKEEPVKAPEAPAEETE